MEAFNIRPEQNDKIRVLKIARNSGAKPVPKLYNNIIEEIIHLTILRPISFTSIKEATDIFIWINGENDFMKKVNKDTSITDQAVNVYFIDDTKETCTDNENYFKIKKDSHCAIILGYFQYLEKLTKCLYGNDVPKEIYEVYKSILKEYTLKNVSEWTGLPIGRLVFLYERLEKADQSHQHLDFNKITNENIIQSIRCISLLAIVHGKEAVVDTLAVSFLGQNLYEVTYQNPLIKDHGTKSIRKINDLSYESENKWQVNNLIYNCYLAERFDVDPFPLYYNMNKRR